jgi:hypothetical protein
VEHQASADNPDPCQHRMKDIPDRAAPGLSFATDRIALNIHGNADSHIDALRSAVGGQGLRTAGSRLSTDPSHSGVRFAPFAVTGSVERSRCRGTKARRKFTPDG